MPLHAKIIVSVALILTASHAGRSSPGLAGLLATMPLTSLLVLLFLAADHPTEPARLAAYCRGALLGIAPTAAFFAVAHASLERGAGLPGALAAAASAWLAGALLHRAYLS